MKNKQLIIFTDLDGTLLDHSTYSFDAALPALKVFKEKTFHLLSVQVKQRQK